MAKFKVVRIWYVEARNPMTAIIKTKHKEHDEVEAVLEHTEDDIKEEDVGIGC